MRISDWSSDVCSSDLDGAGAQGGRPAEGAVARKPPADPLHPGRGREVGVRVGGASQHAAGRGVAAARPAALRPPGADAPRRAHGLDRKRVVEGKRESVRVDPGGRSISKKKNTT